jgi:RNA polymerase sigma-70 factor (ECF subfamily)
MLAASGAPTPQDFERRWDLVLAHRDDLLRIARRRVDSQEDAEDVVSTAMLRTVEHRGLDEQRVGSFLCTTVMRLAVDVHRERARQLAVGRRHATREPVAAPVDEAVCDQSEARWLAARLQHCPQREREVLGARLSGLQGRQVSERLGVTEKAAENAYTRVRQRALALLATTAAVVSLAVQAIRTSLRPAAVAAPVALALVLAVSSTSSQPLAVLPEAPTAAADAPDAAAAQKTGAAETTSVADPASTAARPDIEPPTETEHRPAAPAVPVASAGPARTEVRAPRVVDPTVAEPAGVFYEKGPDEPFERSVQRCVDQVNPLDPLTDPCRAR